MMNSILKIHGSKDKDFVLKALIPGLNNISSSVGSQNNPFIITEDINEASDISDEKQNENLPNKDPKMDIASSSKNKNAFLPGKDPIFDVETSSKSEKIGLLIMQMK